MDVETLRRTEAFNGASKEGQVEWNPGKDDDFDLEELMDS